MKVSDAVIFLLRLFLLPGICGVGAREDTVMVYRGAFSEQLSLVSSDGSLERLAVTDDDHVYLAITVDKATGDVYFATSKSTIQRARYDATKSEPWGVSTVIGGHVEVRIEGYNLGASINDVVSFSVRGVECLTLRRQSSNSLTCVFGDAAVTSDIGQGIGNEDIVVQTAIGGWARGGFYGDFLDAKLADHSLKPIITSVHTTGRTISVGALCFDPTRRYLYYSDLGTRSINRIRLGDDDDVGGNGSAQRVAVDFEALLPAIGTVRGMALDAEEGENGGFLYFTETQGGTVSRIELPAADGGKPGAQHVLASGLMDPMSIALEPGKAGARLYFTLRAGSIRAVARDSYAAAASIPPAARLAGGGYEVRRLDSGTRLDGIAISESEEANAGAEDSAELRLYWSESGRAAGIRRATLDGARPEGVSVVASNDTESAQEMQLVWPRGLAFGAGPSAGLLFTEYLGSIGLLRNPIGEGGAEMIVESDAYPAAVAIRRMVAAADREGKETFFMETVG